MQNRIRELRQEKKITQIRLSIELEVTQETISAYETGKHLPSIRSLLKLSEIFNASLDYIMCLSDIRRPLKETNFKKDEIELLLLYQALNHSKRERAMAYLSGLSES